MWRTFRSKSPVMWNTFQSKSPGCGMPFSGVPFRVKALGEEYLSELKPWVWNTFQMANCEGPPLQRISHKIDLWTFG